MKAAPPRLQASPGKLKAQPKRVDPILQTSKHAAWRQEVMVRAGGRCEAVENGQRCTKTSLLYRMYADHIDERRDGGALFDPRNGQLFCASHHALKTMRERAKRLRH